MKIAEHVWMLASKGSDGPILYLGIARYTRKRLIKDACPRFNGGSTWKDMRRNGWRAVKVKIIGRLP